MANVDDWEDSIHRNYSYFIENIADPHDVAQYLFGETNPPIITDEYLDEIKVGKAPYITEIPPQISTITVDE